MAEQVQGEARLRTNRLRELLGENHPLFGAMLGFPSPRLVEFCGLVGFDWVLLDGEHEGVGVETCSQLVTAADAVGIATVVRVPVNRPDVLLGYADTGANAIIAPHITSAQQAAELVAGLRFPPLGSRGAAASSRAANYGLTQTAEQYFAAVEAHPIPAALIEDASAYADLDAIADTEGLEIYCLGAGDLAGSLGFPGQSAHPKVQELVAGAARKLTALGRVVNMSVADATGTRRALELGATMIVVSNISLLTRAAREFLDAARRTADGTAGTVTAQ